MMWLAADNITFLIAARYFRQYRQRVFPPLLNAIMLGFAVDFGALKTGIKATGILIAFAKYLLHQDGSGLRTAARS